MEEDVSGESSSSILEHIFNLPSYVWNLVFRRSIRFAIFIMIIILMVSLPVFAGTKSYPVAVVDGNSMVPTYHMGDLVFYAAPKTQVKTGTVIVFIQSESGITVFDQVLKPIIIHRIISVTVQPNGDQTYQTKGDNNQAADPFTTGQGNVLGTPVYSIPYLGFPILFFKTAYGMLMIVAMMSLYFFSGVDTQIAQNEAKKRFIAIFARHSLNGEISPAQFERLNVALEYSEEVPSEEIKDPIASSVVDWVQNGGLENDWTEEIVQCPTCNSNSFQVTGQNADILICPNCKSVVTNLHTSSLDLEIERPKLLDQYQDTKKQQAHTEESQPLPLSIEPPSSSTTTVVPKEPAIVSDDQQPDSNEPDLYSDNQQDDQESSSSQASDNYNIIDENNTSNNSGLTLAEATEQLTDQISNILGHTLYSIDQPQDNDPSQEPQTQEETKKKRPKKKYEWESNYYSTQSSEDYDNTLEDNSIDRYNQ